MRFYIGGMLVIKTPAVIEISKTTPEDKESKIQQCWMQRAAMFVTCISLTLTIYAVSKSCLYEFTELNFLSVGS